MRRVLRPEWGQISQLVFEKIKTPKTKEVNSLDETECGDGGYGSAGYGSFKIQRLAPNRIQLIS